QQLELGRDGSGAPRSLCPIHLHRIMTEATSMTARTPAIAVIVPCLNEERTIGAVVADFRAALEHARIIVVDNASTDRTAEIARAAGAEVVRETRRGKGFALLAGVRYASSADIFLMVDGDGTYAAKDAPALIARIEDGADMVIGTRLDGADQGAFPAGHSF